MVELESGSVIRAWDCCREANGKRGEVESHENWTVKTCWDVFLDDQCFYRAVVFLPPQDNASVFVILTICSFQLVGLVFSKGKT